MRRGNRCAPIGTKSGMNKAEVLTAIDENRMYLLLQPVVSSSSLHPVFYEALLRMKTAEGDIIPPIEFIGDAEREDYVHRVDRRTLELGIALLEKHKACDVSLNISSLTTDDHSWVRMLDELTADRRTLTNRLIVEITETAAFNDINRTIAFIDAFRELGCRMAVDDYGVGHTRFMNLNLLSPNIVKIDRSYVVGYEQPDNRKFLEGIVDLSQTLGFETVAEGVETEACAEAVIALGITYMQGFLFGEPALPEIALKPVPA